tara:strand:+ start:1042 stop:1599 length:558 start_codon:yes stop_codon:yes gene_type:complete
MASTLKINNLDSATGSTITVASGKTLDASNGFTPPSGHVVQVVHQNADASGNKVTTSSSTFSSAFTASITPTSSSNKILCIIACSISDTRDGDQLAIGHRIVRQIGSGSDTEITSAKTAYSDSEYVNLHLRYIDHPAAASMVQEQTFNVLDSPNTTTVCNYKIQHKAGTSCSTGGAYFTLMEITA